MDWKAISIRLIIAAVFLAVFVGIICLLSGCHSTDEVELTGTEASQEEGPTYERFVTKQINAITGTTETVSGEVIGVLVDTQTGVQYILHDRGHFQSMAPLLDADGKPILAEGYPKEEQ